MNGRLEEVNSLLFDWESGSLDDQGIERLREILKGDAHARSHFLDLQMISAALQQDAEAAVALPIDRELHLPSNSKAAVATRRFRRPPVWTSIAAALLICALGSWLTYSLITDATDRRPQPQLAGAGSSEVRDPSQEPTSHGVTLVTRLVDVTWHDDQTKFEVGEALPPGRFAMKAGHAQIEFFCGATLVVEGPTELDLKSTTHARVHRGRLRAQVPPAARGFSLEVDGLKVVDLGTEFGLSVSASGANVQVFDGEVELNPASKEKRLLASGQAILRTSAGEYLDTQAAPDSFIDIAGLELRVQRQDSTRYQRWKDSSAQLRRDPRLIAYYAFDESGDWERRLAAGNEPANHELDGAIVGAREVAGRWNAKRALEFKQPADRVRVQIPGEYGSMTLAAWVRIDSLDRWYNSLFLTDGYDKGEPHWQILSDGRLYFSVRPAHRGESGPRDYKAFSPPFWKPSMQGKWIHLAVSCDVTTNTIVHYLDGKVLSRHMVPDAQMPAVTRIGKASIGNWALPTLPDAEFAIRNLNGSIDEFAIFFAALPADEIEDIYEYGKP